MKDIKINEYIELFNPARNNHFPVRILKKTESGYEALLLATNKQINIYNYQLNAYGYRNIWLTEKLLNQLGFKKYGLIYTLESIIVWECLIGELEHIDHPYYLYEYSSKHLGYAILKEKEVKEFKRDFQKIKFKSTTFKIKEKYLFITSINDFFNYLLNEMPKKMEYKFFDTIILNNK